MTITARLLGRVCLWLLLCSCGLANAQHGHDAGVSLLAVTSPKDDSVLDTAPPAVVLSFRSDVRLLKLRLLSAERHNIDIGFSYDPTRVRKNFVWNLPPLPSSSYFILAWAVVDDTNQLVDGELRFAVGADALAPSEFIKRYGLYVDHAATAP